MMIVREYSQDNFQAYICKGRGTRNYLIVSMVDGEIDDYIMGEMMYRDAHIHYDQLIQKAGYEGTQLAVIDTRKEKQ